MRRGPKMVHKSPKNDDRVRDLEKRLAEALKDKAEAPEQYTATSDIRRVNSTSPTDVHLVFETIVKNAARLAVDATIFQGKMTTSDGRVTKTTPWLDRGDYEHRAHPHAHDLSPVWERWQSNCA